MKCELSYINVEFSYSRFFEEIRIKCPFCQHNSRRTKTFKSLKKLTFHLSDQHKDEGEYYPFDMKQIQTIIHMIALAKEWRIL